MSVAHSIESIPAHTENKKQCFICKKEFELNEIIVSTPCHHVFHKACIVQVLKTVRFVLNLVDPIDLSLTLS